MESFWLQVDEGELRQGDYLPGCSIPLVGPAFAVVGEPHEIRTDQGDLIIVRYDSRDGNSPRSRG